MATFSPLEQEPETEALAPIEPEVITPETEQGQEFAEPASEELSDEAKGALSKLAELYEEEESSYRHGVIREVTKNLMFWEGFQDAIYDFESGVHRTSYDAFRHGLIDSSEVRDFSKNVNEYRGHGEAIIAAMSLEIPKTRFFPKRANNPLDIIAARTYSKAAEMILSYNEAKKLLQRAFFIRYNQHFVALHTYFKRSKDYGTIEIPTYGKTTHDFVDEYCSNCGSDYGEESTQQLPPELGLKPCDNCGEFTEPATHEYTEEVTQKIGEDIINKGRVKMDVYGPLHVLLPHYATSEENCGFLRLSTEHHESFLKSILGRSFDTEPSDPEPLERIPRLGSTSNEGLVTLDRWWFAPWAYEDIPDEDLRSEVKRLYPDGVLIYKLNDKVARCYKQRLSDYWAFTKSPISESIHAAPHGRPMIPVQEMSNDLLHMTMETIRHGVSITFADPEVLNFKKFGQTSARPGNVIQAKARPGFSLDSAFYQTSHATLSKEVEPFRAFLQQAGQFVLGSFPSIYGGTLEGSRTFAEYESSRQQALQRLSLPWDDVAFMFSKAQLNAVRCLKDHMSDDQEEQFVVRNGSSFMDVFISLEELSGEIGDVVTDIAPQYPTSWAQKRALIFELFEKQIPEINGVLVLPENSTMLKEITGFNELYIPGAADREVQLFEIAELIKGQPLGPMTPSVPTNPELDNEEIHAETCRVWLNSLEGREAKINNPGGYANVLEHFRLHNQAVQAMYAAEAEQQNEESEGENGETGSGGPPEGAAS